MRVYTALPGATATPECFKPASSDDRKLSKKVESRYSVLQWYCTVKLSK